MTEFIYDKKIRIKMMNLNVLCNASRAISQNFMKELAQSDLLFLSYGSGCITILKIKIKLKILLIQDIV